MFSDSTQGVSALERLHLAEADAVLSEYRVDLELAAQSRDVPSQGRDAVIGSTLETRKLRLGHFRDCREFGLSPLAAQPQLLQAQRLDLRARSAADAGDGFGRQTRIAN